MITTRIKDYNFRIGLPLTFFAILLVVVTGALISYNNYFAFFYIALVTIIIIFLIAMEKVSPILFTAVLFTPFNSIFLIKTSYCDIRISQILWIIIIFRQLMNKKFFTGIKFFRSQIYISSFAMLALEAFFIPFSSFPSTSLREFFQSTILLSIFLCAINFSREETRTLWKAINATFLIGVMLFFYTVITGKYLIPLLKLDLIDSPHFSVIWENIKVEIIEGYISKFRWDIMGLGPTGTGFFYSTLLIIYIAKTMSSKNDKISWVYILTGVTIIILTGSRAPFIGLISGTLLLLFLSKQYKKLMLALPILIVIVSLVSILYPFFVDRLIGLFTIESDGTSQSRVTLWSIGFSKFLERPLIGWGTASFQNLSIYLRTSVGGYTNTNINFHNFIIQLLAEQGIIGLVSNLVFLMFILKFLAHYYHVNINSRDLVLNSSLLAAFFCMLIIALTMNCYRLDVFWLLFGVLICSSKNQVLNV